MLEYHRAKREYLVSYQYRKQPGALQAHPELEEFSSPSDLKGYAAKPITDDLITDLYLEFSDRTRQAESEDYLRTLTGQYLTLAEFKRKNADSVDG